jgi:hypothetical protein
VELGDNLEKALEQALKAVWITFEVGGKTTHRLPVEKRHITYGKLPGFYTFRWGYPQADLNQ